LVWIKICGFCDTESARVAVELGVDAIGLNFVSRSKRRVSVPMARQIAESVRGRVELIGVVESMTLADAAALREDLRLDRIQFHRPVPAQAQGLPQWAYWAVGISGPGDAVGLANYPGELLLVDTIVRGETGGTGQPFDWLLVESIAQLRRVVVAGGLTPENVAAAISQAHPYGVDVASGVELPGAPGQKHPDLLRAFVDNARAADARRRSLVTL
jgi:phosphoribosylanthranilate isomerase